MTTIPDFAPPAVRSREGASRTRETMSASHVTSRPCLERRNCCSSVKGEQWHGFNSGRYSGHIQHQHAAAVPRCRPNSTGCSVRSRKRQRHEPSTMMIRGTGISRRRNGRTQSCGLPYRYGPADDNNGDGNGSINPHLRITIREGEN